MSGLIKSVPLLFCYHFILKLPKNLPSDLIAFNGFLLALAFKFQNQSNHFNRKLHIVFFLTNHLLHVLIPTLFSFILESPKTFSLLLQFPTPPHLPFFFFILPFAFCPFGFHLLFFSLLALGPPSHFLSFFAFLHFLFSLSSNRQLSHPFFLSSFFSSRPALAPVISSGGRSVSYVESRHCNDGIYRAVPVA